MKHPILLALWFALFSVTGLSRAKEEASPDKGQSKDSWASSRLDVDKEVDDGADDDKNNENTGSDKFKKDPDDSYKDGSSGGDGWLKSRFGKDLDKDTDSDTDGDDQSAKAPN